ncbi:hypothetical protein [Streptomyces sp. ALI-76-A]|uniref:hypothetical protein n=1 Tax=Streptomyces sp. ALI-76-A TaxID=3025736 RepID=UPI00256F2561|nr:hypothetical protein [Streptomyces sp. ALI-76-A]MDL5199147.1 hypothetical protein [Streptomyces sp. ALI-76-A]
MAERGGGLMSSADTRKRSFVVPPVLLGFIFLLFSLTAGAYVVGRLAGPVAPGMHRIDEDPGGVEKPGMSDMHGMGGTDRAAREGR